VQRFVRGAVLVAVLVALAGCGAGPGGGPGTGVEHVVVAERTDLAPGNASTVDASAPVLADADAVQAALTEAATGDDEVAIVRVSERRFAVLNRTLAGIPGVADQPGDEAVAATLYVAHDGDVYRVTLRKRWLV
jgi:hypothetical protein